MYIKQNYEIKNGQATLEDFKRWCKKFPNPFQKGETPKYYRSKVDDRYFMSLERVRGNGLFNKYDFIGKTLRVYRDKPSDWALPSGKESDDELIEKYFPGIVTEYEREIYGE